MTRNSLAPPTPSLVKKRASGHRFWAICCLGLGWVVQGWIATEKLEWVVEKAVELGVARIALAAVKGEPLENIVNGPFS